MFSTCPSVRPFVRSLVSWQSCEHGVFKKNWPVLLQIGTSCPGNEMKWLMYWGQKVKYQGHTSPKLPVHLEVWRRHRSWFSRSSSIRQMSLLPCCMTVDGGWSAWSAWSECSLSCGRGLAVRHRTCTQPSPSVGARFCRGDAVNTRACQTSCPPGNDVTVFTTRHAVTPTQRRSSSISIQKINS